ncbi:MAG: hypothetical protein H7829_13660 [Magnetococcus sp. THC-1_WYH]
MIHPTESETVRTIFRRFVEIGFATQLIRDVSSRPKWYTMGGYWHLLSAR